MERPEWLLGMKRFARPDVGRSIRELFNSILPYFCLCAVMYVAIWLRLPYVIVIALSIPAAGFLVRTFIILHDCGHYSFSDSPQMNSTFGHLCGILTFTPFRDFRRSHALHHVTVGNLDKRGVGDVWTMTLGEFRAAKTSKRFLYRFTRNPVVLFLVLAPLKFIILNRIPSSHARKFDALGTYLTDLALAVIIFIAAKTIGIAAYIAIQLPIMYFASVAGLWLFFIQHQFPGVYWVRDSEWNYIKASLIGSSFYDLPPLLRWFSGNIGYHHIHHLHPRIPNYRLKECYESVPETRVIKPISFRDGFKSLHLHLYDEVEGKLISFKEANSKMK